MSWAFWHKVECLECGTDAEWQIVFNIFWSQIAIAALLDAWWEETKQFDGDNSTISRTEFLDMLTDNPPL